MLVAAEELKFEYAAKLRDEIKDLRGSCRRSLPEMLDGPLSTHDCGVEV
jgi:excinuclease UvrABC nuclease subunit